MKAVGIGGFLQFDAGLNLPQGPVIYNSPKFHEIYQFAISEAERLGLDAGFHNTSGWSSSGGPWIKPENSMKMLIWRDTIIENTKSIDLVLKPPTFNIDRWNGKNAPKKSDFYRDIVVLAYPTPKDTSIYLENWKEKSLYAQDAKPDKFIPYLKPSNSDAIISFNTIIDISNNMDANGKINWNPPKVGNWTIVRMGYTTTGANNRPASKGAIGLEVDKLSRKAVDVHWDSLVSKIIADAKEKKALTTVTIDSYEVGMQNWTDEFASEFKKRRGYEMIPMLVCATGRIVDNTETTERVLWDFRFTIAELMHENYFGYFAEKCHEKGLKLAIEPYGSGAFDAPTTTKIADLPMTEFWDGPVRNLWQWTSQVVSGSAHLSGKSVVGAEAFTSMTGNYKDAPYTLKSSGDLAFAKGVNRYYFHAFAHQPWNDAVKPGMSFGRFGGNYHRNNTWFPKSKAWMEYIARCQYIFQSGTYQADVLALYGDERAFNCFISQNEPIDVKCLDGINSDLGGINTLNDLSVEKNGVIRVTYKGKLLDNRYKVILLKRADLMLPEHVAKLCELADKGAKIYAPKPLRSPSLSNAVEADKLIQTLIQKYWESGKIRNPKTFNEDIKKITPDCVTPKEFVFSRTKIGNDDYYFVSNQKHENTEAKCRFRVSGKQPEIWDPTNGTITDATNWTMFEDGTTEVQLDMDPAGAVFVVFRKPTSAKGLSTPKPTFNQIAIDGKWTVTFDPKWGPKNPIELDSLQTWNQSTNEEIKYFSGSALYKNEFTISKKQMSTSPIYLDLGKVEVFAKVTLNGKELGTLWKAPYRVEISKSIKKGINLLEIEVTNLWVNRLIGDERFEDFDRKNIDWLSKGLAPSADAPRKTFLAKSIWKKEDVLVPSGLIGPVSLLFTK